MTYSSSVASNIYETYILSFLHVCLESAVQDHIANLETLYPCLYHQMLSKFAATQKKMFNAIKDVK